MNLGSKSGVSSGPPKLARLTQLKCWLRSLKNKASAAVGWRSTEWTLNRNHNDEHSDSAERKYAYDFDWVVRRYLLRAFEPRIVRAGGTLELGCFRGDMTEQILSFVDDATVVEAASDLSAHVRSRFGDRVKVITSTFEDARIDERFANIFLVHTLEHLDDPVGVLRRVRTWLTESGHLFIAVPNANALSRQIAVRMGLVKYNSAVTPSEAAHGHRRTYSLDLLLSHANDAGLKVIGSGGVLVKALANFQFDQAISSGIIDEAYLDGCDALARIYPEFSATVFAICTLP